MKGRQGGLQGIARRLRHRSCFGTRQGWRDRTGRRTQGRLDHEFGRFKSEGSGCVEKFGGSEPQFGPPHRSIDDKNEPAALEVGQPRMRGQRRWQEGTQLTVQPVEPQGSTDRVTSRFGKQRFERGLRGGGATRSWRFGHVKNRIGQMTHPLIVNKFRKKPLARLVDSLNSLGARRPALAVCALLGVGFIAGGASGLLGTAGLRMQMGDQKAQLAASRRESQREINALAARLGELQAEANRLNALGERLTRIGQLQDGEFNFDKPVGVGGTGPVRDISRPELHEGLDTLNRQFVQSGEQLSVLESMLFNRQLDMNSVPSREPIADSYITSGFGRRVDPIVGGSQFHKGIDFEADVGDPVLAVADGVVSFAGVRSGYGNVIEIDHGNGYVTRYAHNSRLEHHVGELIRAGQEIAKAGSTGRSTGAHVHLEVWKNGQAVNPRNFLSQHSPLVNG